MTKYTSQQNICIEMNTQMAEHNMNNRAIDI